MAEEFYEAPREKISQGDIFHLLPHVYVERPLLALNKEADSPFRATSEPFSVFDDKNGQAILAKCKRKTAILITNDCEIDKPQLKKWLVCPVLPVTVLRNTNQDLVRRNRIYSMFHLPKHRESLAESFVDFNQITTLQVELVTPAERVTSLSNVGRLGLYAQFVRWLTRWELRELTCPHCGVTSDPLSELTVRAEDA